MKYILPLIMVCFLANSSIAGINWPWNKKESKSAPVVNVEKKKAPATINNARQVIRELNSELQTAKQQNIKLKDNLDRANAKVVAAEKETLIVKAAIEKLKEWGIVQQAEKFQWMEKYEKAIKRYHRLKMIAALIAAAAGIFVGLQFMNLVPPPYNFGVPIGGALLFSSLVWLLL
jgi:hypothetical protein